jgi:steroid 5-alpha reductase family enzyme
MNYYTSLALVLFIYMSVWFIISLFKKRNDVADIAWGLGFIILTWSSFWVRDFDSGLRGMLIGILISIWGLRLAYHIYKRNKGKIEDYRYLAWRQAWGKWFYPRSYLQVYILQGILLFMIVLPTLVINKNLSSPFGLLDVLGLIVWVIGFFFESVGDKQLAVFIKNPENKGKLMREGLWKYTRHPNYFGEVTMWWGIWIISLSVDMVWFSVLGPLTITVLILKISGIPMLEIKMKENPDFADYEKKTNKFIPWFVKN